MNSERTMQTNTIIPGACALFVASVAGFAAGMTLSHTTKQVTQPEKQHAWLAQMAGEYKTKVSGMMGESEGTSRTESAMGGFWNVTHFHGTMMNQPFEGMEILGFDPEKDKFVSVWVDSMTPKITALEGTYDIDSKTLTMRGESTGMDGETAEMVNTTVFNDGGMVFTMEIEGSPAPVMTIEYTRDEK